MNVGGVGVVTAVVVGGLFGLIALNEILEILSSLSGILLAIVSLALFGFLFGPVSSFFSKRERAEASDRLRNPPIRVGTYLDRHGVERCLLWECGKVAYLDREAATKAANDMNKRYPHRAEQKPYPSHECGYYHLTTSKAPTNTQ